VSWPRDGGPRYIVRETWGYGITPAASANGTRKPDVSVAVLDRAICHRVHLHLTPRSGPLAARRHLARERAAVLEAKHRAALSD
jgi:hypothetical protein